MTEYDEQARGWCLTINNYTDDDEVSVKSYVNKLIYYAVGYEIGEQGTPHLQIYFEYKSMTRFSTIKKKFRTAHIEARKGTRREAYDYCLEDLDERNFFSERPPEDQKGKRNDLEYFTEQMRTRPVHDVANEMPHIFVKYPNGLHQLATIYSEHRDAKFPPIVTWMWGLAGTGKSRKVHDNHHPDDLYTKFAGIWWDGYHQQEAILIEDFDHTTFPFREFLRIIDRYPYTAQIKGGTVKINSPFFYITSEYHPKHFYGSDNTYAQVARRITSIIHYE